MPTRNQVQLYEPARPWAGQTILVLITCFRPEPRVVRGEFHVLSTHDGITIDRWHHGYEPLTLSRSEEVQERTLDEMLSGAQHFVEQWASNHALGIAKAKADRIDVTLEPVTEGELVRRARSPEWREALQWVVEQSQNPILVNQISLAIRAAESGSRPD